MVASLHIQFWEKTIYDTQWRFSSCCKLTLMKWKLNALVSKYTNSRQPKFAEIWRNEKVTKWMKISINWIRKTLLKINSETTILLFCSICENFCICIIYKNATKSYYFILNIAQLCKIKTYQISFQRYDIIFKLILIRMSVRICFSFENQKNYQWIYQIESTTNDKKKTISADDYQLCTLNPKYTAFNSACR